MSPVSVQKLKFTESDRLLVQIQAYLDNVFDVGALLEDAETKNALLEHMEELQEHNTQVDILHTRGTVQPCSEAMQTQILKLCFGVTVELQASGE